MKTSFFVNLVIRNQKRSLFSAMTLFVRVLFSDPCVFVGLFYSALQVCVFLFQP